MNFIFHNRGRQNACYFDDNSELMNELPIPSGKMTFLNPLWKNPGIELAEVQVRFTMKGNSSWNNLKKAVRIKRPFNWLTIQTHSSRSRMHDFKALQRVFFNVLLITHINPQYYSYLKFWPYFGAQLTNKKMFWDLMILTEHVGLEELLMNEGHYHLIELSPSCCGFILCWPS